MSTEYESMMENTYPPITGGQDQYFSNAHSNGMINENSENIGSLQSLAPIDTSEKWFKKYWRPAMAWQYLAVCLFDFIVAPTALTAFLYMTGQSYIAWAPLTLTAGGLYHMAMAVILGIAAWSHGQEKLNGIE